MQRMVELQQQQEEECTQEEMVTRFERERSVSIPTGTNIAAHLCIALSFTQLTFVYLPLPLCCVCLAVVRGAPPDLVLCLVEDPEFRYEDFAPRGEQSPTTMRAQVVLEHFYVLKLKCKQIIEYASVCLVTSYLLFFLAENSLNCKSLFLNFFQNKIQYDR